MLVKKIPENQIFKKYIKFTGDIIIRIQNYLFLLIFQSHFSEIW